MVEFRSKPGPWDSRAWSRGTTARMPLKRALGAHHGGWQVEKGHSLSPLCLPIAFKPPHLLESYPWERMPQSPRGLESSLKTGPFQNHMWHSVVISYKVSIPVHTRKKQNHPGGTHRMKDLKKCLLVPMCKEKIRERERKQQNSSVLCQIHGPTATHNKHSGKHPGTPNAIWFILGRSWVSYI